MKRDHPVSGAAKYAVCWRQGSVVNYSANNEQNARQLKSGQVLFNEGDNADCAYIVEEGKLEISTSSEGQVVIITHLGAGEIVGEMGVIDSAPRTATARATSSSTSTSVMLPSALPSAA